MIALALCLLLADPQPAEGGPSRTAEPPTAESLFHEGLKAYDAHAYGRALSFFEEAYALSPLPEIQFDIAQSYRALGDCKNAVEHFDLFLSAVSSGDPLADRARARRQELLSCAGEEPPIPPPRARVALEAPRTVVAAVPVLTSSPRSGGGRAAARFACAGGVGAALAAGVAGAVFELQARSTQQTVELTATWDTAAQRSDERGRTLAEVGTVLLVSAGVAALGAAAACWIGWSSRGADH